MQPWWAKIDFLPKALKNPNLLTHKAMIIKRNLSKSSHLSKPFTLQTSVEYTHTHIAGAAQAFAGCPLWVRRKMRGSRYEKYRYGPDALDRTGQIKQPKPHRAAKHTHKHTSLSNPLPQTQGETFKRQAPQSTPCNRLNGCRWSRVITQQCFSSRSTSETPYTHNCQYRPIHHKRFLRDFKNCCHLRYEHLFACLFF